MNGLDWTGLDCELGPGLPPSTSRVLPRHLGRGDCLRLPASCRTWPKRAVRSSTTPSLAAIHEDEADTGPVAVHGSTWDPGAMHLVASNATKTRPSRGSSSFYHRPRGSSSFYHRPGQAWAWPGLRLGRASHFATQLCRCVSLVV